MYCAPQTAHLSGRLVSLDNGTAGTLQTLRTMRKLANEGSTHLAVINAAVSAIFLTPARDEYAEISAIFEMVRSRIRYVRDVWGVEVVATPDATLQRRVGDCDDQVTLLAALLQSVGYPTRFVVVGFSTPNEYEHVYLQACTADGWIALDPTEAHPLGWEPPNPVAIHHERV